MTWVPARTERTDAQPWAEVRDMEALRGVLRPGLLAAVRTVLKTMMVPGPWEHLFLGAPVGRPPRADLLPAFADRLLASLLALPPRK